MVAGPGLLGIRDGDAGHLLKQVLEVDCAEKDVRARVEEDRDRDDSDEHRQAADVARPDRPPAGAKNRRDAVLVFGGGLDIGRCGRAHVTTSVSSGAGAPKVIASTTSRSLVLLFS